MRARGGGAADEQRQAQSLPLHLARYVRHLLERRRDQARQADGVGLFALRGVENGLRWHHDAEVEHLVVVALEHHGDDVLANIVHVALHRSEHDAAFGPAGVAGLRFFGLDIGHEVRHRLLHHPCRLDDLRQKHLAGAEQVADDVHAVHQRTFDHLDRPRVFQARLFSVGDDVRRHAVDERVRQALRHAARTPGVLLAGLLGRCLHAAGEFNQPLGGVGPPVEDDILRALAQLRVELLVDAQLAGVDDAHRHAGLDGVVQKRGVHRFAHRVVAAERERQVRNAPRDLGLRQLRADPAHRFEVFNAVARMLVQPRRNGEDVRIEDDVLGRVAHAGEQPVGALGNGDAPLERVGLALLVERHDDHRRAVAAAEPRLAQELGLAFLEGDGVDDRLALHAFQPRLDHAPARAVDHQRHARDIGLRGEQAQEGAHRLFRIEHRLVHVDVDDLRAVLHLLACDHQRTGVIAGEHQPRKGARSCDVGALADVDEERALVDVERLEAR